MQVQADYVTVKQAANLLGVELARVYNLLAAGRISGEQILGRWKVDRESVEDYGRRRRKGGSEDNGSDQRQAEHVTAPPATAGLGR